jgi:NADH dehydrogenase FAD-containing subunit
MFVKEQGEGSVRRLLILSPPSSPASITVPFGLLVWSTGLAPNPLIQSIDSIEKDEKTQR